VTAHGTAIRIRVGTGWEQLQGRPMAAKSLTHAPVALALPVAVAMWQCGNVALWLWCVWQVFCGQTTLKFKVPDNVLCCISIILNFN